MLKLEAQGNLFCSALQFSLWFKAAASDRKTVRVSSREDFRELWSESALRDSVELQPVFVIENFSLHYIWAARNLQQTTAEKRAAHTSMVETLIHFWWRSMSWCALSPGELRILVEVNYESSVVYERNEKYSAFLSEKATV